MSTAFSLKDEERLVEALIRANEAAKLSWETEYEGFATEVGKTTITLHNRARRASNYVLRLEPSLGGFCIVDSSREPRDEEEEAQSQNLLQRLYSSVEKTIQKKVDELLEAILQDLS